MEGLILVLMIAAAGIGGWFYLKRRRSNSGIGTVEGRPDDPAPTGTDVLDMSRVEGGVKASAFRLVGDNGETGASVMMVGDSPYLTLSDRSGLGRLFITINHEEQASLFLRDRNGETRMAALVDVNGDEPIIALYGQDGRDRRL